MKLFTYRGKRVHAFHRNIKGITWFIWWFPFLLVFSYYVFLHFEQLKVHPLPQSYFIGVLIFLSALLTLGINWLCYEKILFFQKLNSLRILSRFLLENNLYLVKKVKRDKGIVEKVTLPKVYLKQSRYELQVSFILEGNKFQDRFLNLGSTLEVPHVHHPCFIKSRLHRYLRS